MRIFYFGKFLSTKFNNFCFFTADGWYVYIEASSPRVKDQVARLESEVIDTPSLYCVDFWYHMYGADIGALNVYIRPTGQNLGSPYWTRSGTLDDKWYRANFPVSLTSDWQVCIVKHVWWKIYPLQHWCKLVIFKTILYMYL